jgi:hypothetical protein
MLNRGGISAAQHSLRLNVACAPWQHDHSLMEGGAHDHWLYPETQGSGGGLRFAA